MGSSKSSFFYQQFSCSVFLLSLFSYRYQNYIMVPAQIQMRLCQPVYCQMKLILTNCALGNKFIAYLVSFIKSVHRQRLSKSKIRIIIFRWEWLKNHQKFKRKNEQLSSILILSKILFYRFRSFYFNILILVQGNRIKEISGDNSILQDLACRVQQIHLKVKHKIICKGQIELKCISRYDGLAYIQATKFFNCILTSQGGKQVIHIKRWLLLTKHSQIHQTKNQEIKICLFSLLSIQKHMINEIINFRQVFIKSQFGARVLVYTFKVFFDFNNLLQRLNYLFYHFQSNLSQKI